MRVRVLGSAAGGGFPQWNCGCPNCSGLRNGSIKARPRTQAQVAVSPDPSRWFLLNASPDLRQQILATPELSVISSSLGPPISTILLTSADVDSVMGLLHLREFQPLRIYSTLSVRRALTEENSLFRVLSRSSPPVQWETREHQRGRPMTQRRAGFQPARCFSGVRPSSGTETPDGLRGIRRAGACRSRCGRGRLPRTAALR